MGSLPLESIYIPFLLTEGRQEIHLKTRLKFGLVGHSPERLVSRVGQKSVSFGETVGSVVGSHGILSPILFSQI